MKDKQKQIKEESKKTKQPVQIKPAAESLSEAELDKVAGGAGTPGFLKASSRISD